MTEHSQLLSSETVKPTARNENIIDYFESNEFTCGIDAASDPLVSDRVIFFYKWIWFAVVCQLVDTFGAVTNIINIICFVKQGVGDSVNISLLGLAISDLGCVMTLIWLNMGLTPAFQDADLPFIAVDIDYLTAGWTHVIFARVTSWITALITLERCLCITVPLKVKTIVTPKRVAIVILVLIIIIMSTICPVFVVNRLGPKFDPIRNKTLVGLVHTEDRESVEKISFPINNIIVPFTAFVTVLTSTITLVVKLRNKTQWRKTVSTSDNSISSRDQKVTKMVIMISTLFIICFTPVCIIFAGMTSEPELSVNGKYRNVFLIVFGIGFFLEGTNSSVNIFIYYWMSSRYRLVFRRLFRCSDSEEQSVNSNSSTRRSRLKRSWCS